MGREQFVSDFHFGVSSAALVESKGNEHLYFQRLLSLGMHDALSFRLQAEGHRKNRHAWFSG